MVADHQNGIVDRIYCILDYLDRRYGNLFLTSVSISSPTWPIRGVSVFFSISLKLVLYSAVAKRLFSSCRKLRNPRNRLHMHLFASFIMRASMTLLMYWIFIYGIGLFWDPIFIDGKVFIKELEVENIYIVY